MSEMQKKEGMTILPYEKYCTAVGRSVCGLPLSPREFLVFLLDTINTTLD